LEEAEISELKFHPRSYVKCQVQQWRAAEDPKERQLAKKSPGEGQSGSQREPTDYRDVGLHLKGNYGTFQPFEKKPSLTLNFDKFVPGQKFHGLDKLHLNNSAQDPSLISEVLCRELFKAAGVPVARATHATVELNGRDAGLYVLV